MENKTHNEDQHVAQVTNSTKKMSTSSAILLGSMIIGLSIIIGMSRSGTMTNMAIDPEKIFQGRPFAAEETLMGKPNDDVVFLTYSDTECPFCKMFENETVTKIRENYKGKIAYVYRKYPLPMHPQATTESLATLCAREMSGVEAYDKFNTAIFAKTKSNNGFDMAQLPIIAKDLGLDLNQFNSCMSASSTKMTLQADIEDGVAAGVEGTPYSLILVKRGKDYQIISKINGARDYAYVSKALDLALKYK